MPRKSGMPGLACTARFGVAIACLLLFSTFPAEAARPADRGQPSLQHTRAAGVIKSEPGESTSAADSFPPQTAAPGIYMLSMAYPSTWKDISEYQEWVDIEAVGNSTTGFLVHGLWPDPETATTKSDEKFDPALLPQELQDELAVYYRDSPAAAGSADLHAFWEAQWEKHGSYAQVPVVIWHELILKLAKKASTKLSDAIAPLFPPGSGDPQPAVKDIGNALSTVFPEPVLSYPGGLHCAKSSDRATVLTEVRLCVSPTPGGEFKLGGCTGHSVSAGSTSCGPAKSPVLLPRTSSHRGDFCFVPHSELETVAPRSCMVGADYVLSLVYGPAHFKESDHFALRRLTDNFEFTGGFAVDGLWRNPQVRSPFPFNCSMVPAKTPEEWTENEDLADLIRPLSFFARMDASAEPENHISLWNSFWDDFGRCSGLSQVDYFQVLITAARQFGSHKPLQRIAANPRGKQGVSLSLGDIKAGIASTYGAPGILSSPAGLECALLDDQLTLKGIKLCLVQDPLYGVLKPGDCSDSAPGLARAGPPSCGEDDDAEIFFPVYANQRNRFLEVTKIVALVLLCSVLILSALGALVFFSTMMDLPMIPSWRVIHVRVATMWDSMASKPLFVPQHPVPVSNPLVHQPVEVITRKLDLNAMKHSMPGLVDFVVQLPVGMGIKGGVARKIVKMQEGNPEPPGSFDIDVIAFTDQEVTPELSQDAREKVTGLKVGSLTIEAQDVEVRNKDSLVDYFMTRDITQNEVVLIKRGPNDVILLLTRACETDCRLGRATPSVHALSSGLTVSWDVDEHGDCYVAEHIMTRTIVRLIKGHATEYNVDPLTWEHYRTHGLSWISLFKILKHFHDDDDKYQFAIDHLVGIGVLDRQTIREKGGANALWGHLLLEVNTACSRYGGRLTLTDLDPEAVEKWLAQKKAKLGDKLVSNTWRAKRIGFYPVDETVETLGLITFPQELEEFMRDGPVVYNGPQSSPPPQEAAASGSRSLGPFHFGSKAARASQSKAALRVPRGFNRTRSGTPSGSFSDATTPLLSDDASNSGNGSSHLSYAQKPIVGRSVQESVANRSYDFNVEHSAHSGLRPTHSDKLEVGFFELANPDLDKDTNKGPLDLLNLMPSSYGQPSKISRVELLQFVVGVAWPFKWYLLAAYTLLLAALGFRLLTSKYEGDTLNALQEGGVAQFMASFRMVILVWVCSLGTEIAGEFAMQVFSRRAMQDLFTKLFSHLIHQDVELFRRLTVGEVSARCSGDSLTLKGIITFTGFSIISGSVQALVALVLLMASAMEVFKYSPLLSLAAPAALFIEVAYSIFFGALIAHPLNHQARRCLGRMYGFLFDTFSQISTVQALGLVSRQLVDYCKFVEHYWSSRLKLDLWLVFEGGFSSAVGVALTLLFLLSLGQAYFARAIFGIGTIYSVLRYVQFMQHGVKTASDGFARLAASLGSVERLVELHNTGKLFNGDLRTPQTPHMDDSDDGHGTQPVGGAERPKAERSIGDLTGGLRLVDCHCNYPYKSDHVVLKGINIELRSGCVVAVHGRSGSGKSSVLRTAYLTLQPFKGHVEFQVLDTSGRASTSGTSTVWKKFSPLYHDATEIRDQIAVCSMETFGTFFASIETNIACAAVGEVTASEVRQACEMVGLDTVVFGSLNDGYFSPIGGPSGVALNNDLLVRLSLARAVIRKPKICLLDETDHFCYVVGIDLMKKVLNHLVQGGCGVLLSVWNLELGKELVVAPSDKPNMKLIHVLREGHLV